MIFNMSDNDNYDYGVLKGYDPFTFSNSVIYKTIIGSLSPLTNGQLVIVRDTVGGFYGNDLSQSVDELPIGIYRIYTPVTVTSGDDNRTYYTFESYTKVGEYTETLDKRVSLLEEDLLNKSMENVNHSKTKVGYINSLNAFSPTKIVAIQRTITYTNGVGELDISDMGIQVIFPLNVNVVGSANTYGAILTTINSGAGLRATLNNASYNGNLPTTFLLLCAV